MRTLAAGLSVLKRTPWAIAPVAIEGAFGACLVAIGVLPAGGSGASVAAAFPFDVYFDLKQSLAQTTSWPIFFLVLVVAIGIRGSVLVMTFVLSEAEYASLPDALRRGVSLAAAAAAALFPAAAAMFIGTSSRYAPFVWFGALAGFLPALALARRAVRMDVGSGERTTAGLPEGFGFLAYGLLIALFGSAMASLDDVSTLASAAVVLFTAPLHGLILLGWREHSRRETYPGGGAVAAALVSVVIGLLVVGTVYDRYVRTPPPLARATNQGTLLVLGGVDSTPTEGALADLDPRQVGYDLDRTEPVSYRGRNEAWSKADTRRDPALVAGVVAGQIADAERPVALLGHSQAALILDRLLDRGEEAPDRAVVLAPPPPFPPRLSIPPPGRSGVGKPGGDVARAAARLLETVGLESYDVDSGSFPTNLEPVVLIDTRVRRLAIWALGDSVWLEGDWRRPGESNVVALTDHVGVTNNGRALTSARAFFAGSSISGDEASWRGAAVAVLSHAFAPWRPQVPE